ncbi:MAG: 5'-nucleotidase C-terminal domain-containing protein [Lachnospiraceae bacterium]|jgi:2',3'-cyclic-nucleotide 2'-phosphodiesterase (5'-nucleotidase family)|nr:5'-nucleotidase C-terminal domain-containing protein [Lachnospiraceae bacterium]
MKNITGHKRIPLSTLKALLLSLTAFSLLLFTSPHPAAAADVASSDYVTIIFTHDLHSHFAPARYLMEDGQVGLRGGFANLETRIDAILNVHPDSFIFDAGDFSMGTLFQTLFSDEAPELRLLAMMGFDAVTLGNHEFDYRDSGLAAMLDAAILSGDSLPIIALANIDWELSLANDDTHVVATLQTAMKNYGVVEDYFILEKGGVKAAVFGLIGKQAASYAPETRLHFHDPITAAAAVVAKIKADGLADIIICISHSGTSHDPRRSEDELLAAAVPEIDVIVSGHSHTLMSAPITVGQTHIVSSGEHAYDLGVLFLTRDSDDRFGVRGFMTLPVSDEPLVADPPEVSAFNFRSALLTNEPSEKITAKINSFRDLINENYLSLFGYQYDQVIARSIFSFTPIEEFAMTLRDEALGNLISDSYIYAVQKAEGAAYRPVDVAVVPSGVIRESFAAGEITVAEVFNVSSLGIGPDLIPGYPLVSLYLTGRELKTAAEIDVSVSPLMSDAQLYMSGLVYQYNLRRLPLNRVTNVQLVNSNGSISDLENDKLYRVIGGLYSCQMLGAVTDVSYGLLRIEPKDEHGNPVTDFEEHIVYDGTRELKEWYALAQYLESFPQIDGLSQIPEEYRYAAGRKTELYDRSLIALVSNPNKFFFIIIGAGVLVLTILILPPVLIVRRVRKKKKRG